MDVNWYQNGTEKPNGFVKGFGRMFYIVDPKDTFFENEKDVPNFYVQSWPYFLIFMILEHIVLKLEGKKGLRLNESITSVSNGIFLEGGRLIWRGAESYMYTWIYTNWRLVELPWDSTSTWILAAIGVDFCYYWMHRACHEVHILWAQHQVHHTSEDFNMGVGIRQSMLQGWCGFLVYLPLALAIPPAQFVMHHQFSYLYMFWIHTESIKTLGPLEYILNTPSHHRIHHGSNPYCIDVNYGGVLIIWDKLFGTFRGEKEGDRIVYGLIFQQPSFNPLHLQTFYTKYVVNSFKSYDKWSHKVRAVFDRPSWKPVPYVRFKDMPEDPAIHTRPKYDVTLPRWCTGYLLIHYTAVLYGFYQVFLRHLELPSSTLFILVLYILASLTVFGMILDASPKAPYYETLRCLSFLTLANWFSPILAVNVMIKFMYLMSGMFWFIFVCNSKEIQPY
ncbi:alkylglycerol monooxygenase-like [Manduca sexta]|uniref:alkylglycerol monooxygenase-like n=1 Tax=Manduca sexta TaxID=7130 RepID=UPI00188F1047|nr:alkylglycerol monooxygenase-like [Manduca sexta]